MDIFYHDHAALWQKVVNNGVRALTAWPQIWITQSII